MNNTAIFSISTNNFKNHAEVALNSFLENCDYKNNVDSYNITIGDIQNQKYINNRIDNLISRYKNAPNDILRWALKPSIILYFLHDKDYNNVIYIDNDLYFINNNTFLIDSLDKGVLLTKHNRPIYPQVSFLTNSSGKIRYESSQFNYNYFEQFLCNFTDGFFNAGFIGANKLGKPAIGWWAEMNYWQCAKSYNHGLYVDQKYLDILALEFCNITRICNHPGCNLAVWNTQTITRSFKDNKWKINDLYDPIFFHFSALSESSDDEMLVYYYKEYKNKINNINI